jgi:hypothetical protein
LTGPGKIIGATLLLFPIGLQLIGKEWLGKIIHFGTIWNITLDLPVLSLGIFFLAAPALGALVVYLMWRPTWKLRDPAFRTRNNWLRHRAPHGDSTIFSLFVNKAIDRVHNRIIKTADPTAIEFQETFRQLIAEISNAKRRFVL